MKSKSALFLAAALMALAAGMPADAQQAAGDSHPDLTGVWAGPFRVHASGFPLITGSTPWLAPSQGDPYTYKILTLDEVSAIVDKSVAEHHGAPNFGQPVPPPPPLTDAGLAATRAVDYKEMQKRELGCYPGNVLDLGATFEIVQNPRAIAIMHDAGTPGRMIWMDGRSQKDAIPQWNGNSVGRWDGNKLKVHTVAIRGDGFGFMPHMVMDENLVMDEEYTLQPDGQSLDILVTITDPAIYKEPLRKLIHVKRSPDVLVTDYTCTEGKDGSIETIAKPPEQDGPPPGFDPLAPGPAGGPPPPPGGKRAS